MAVISRRSESSIRPLRSLAAGVHRAGSVSLAEDSRIGGSEEALDCFMRDSIEISGEGKASARTHQSPSHDQTQPTALHHNHLLCQCTGGFIVSTIDTFFVIMVIIEMAVMIHFIIHGHR